MHMTMQTTPHQVDDSLFHDDVQKAFMVTLRPISDGSFIPLNDVTNQRDFLSVAVASRLASSRSSLKDLSRYRVVVKDVFDICGTKTSAGNKAYLSLYPPATSTATAIADLIDRGIQVLGKTKLSSLLSREEPSEAVDYERVWNPRGDGYQTPGGSSSGSTAAVAAYEWVGIGIGTDTNGSIRRPAQCCGVFGLRVSQGVFSHEGMFTVFKRFDVPGLFVRDLGVMVDFATEWYAKSLEAPKTNGLPWKLVYVTDNFSIEDTPQKRCVMGDLRVMELILGVEAIGVSVEDLWNTNPLENANRESLRDFLKEVGASTLLYTNYHSATNFRADDRKVHGIDPPVSKFVQWRWKIGKQYSEAQHKEGMCRLDIYKQWWLNTILETGEKNTFVVMQSEDVKPNYRDDAPPGYHVQDAWHPWWVAPILGAPEIVVPAGQIPYDSRITGVKECLPVMTSIMSQPRSDAALLSTTRDFFEDFGRPMAVKSGKVMWDVV